MNTLILAAGFGTRLYPLTENTPKGLIEINNMPIIEYTIRKIQEEVSNLDTIYILSNNKFHNQYVNWLKNFLKYPKTNNLIAKNDIRILNNGVDDVTEARGVVKDLKFALDEIGDEKELLVLGSDNIYCFDLNRFVEDGRKNKRPSTALRKTTKELTKAYSSVLIDENDKIISFQEKPEHPKSDLASIFCYYLTKNEMDILKSEDYEGRNIIETLYPQVDFYGYSFKEQWFDIGSLEELVKVRKYFKR